MEENERKAWLKGPPGARPIGAFAGRMLDPIARARGFATTALFSEWGTIVGEELASFTLPDKIAWPRRSEDREVATSPSAYREEGAILVLKVDGPRAIEVQHRSEQILERVNRYFGYRAIAQLRFLQAPVKRAASTPPTSPPLEELPLPASAAIQDTDLRRALTRLGTFLRGKMRA
jgi:hypothetical protein